MNLLDTRIIRDWLTGLDGETFALGRGLGVLLSLVCLLLAVGVTIALLVTKPGSTLPEWGAYLAGLGAFIVSVFTAAWIMIRGTNATEPPAPPAAEGTTA